MSSGSVDQPEPASASTELPCVGCGYDLQGLDRDGGCPECGVPVARSLAGDRIADADPAWRGRVQRGQALLATGAIMVVATFVVFMIIGISAGLTGILSVAPFLAHWSVEVIAEIVIWSGLAVSTAGAFLLTAPDPRDSLREPRVNARTAARSGLVASLVTGAAFVAAPHLAAPAPTRAVVGVLFGVAATVSISAILHRQAYLAARVPAAPLAAALRRTGRRLAWLLPVAIVAAIAHRIMPALAAYVVGPGPGATALGAAATIAFAVLWLSVIANGAAVVGLQRRLRRALGAPVAG